MKFLLILLLQVLIYTQALAKTNTFISNKHSIKFIKNDSLVFSGQVYTYKLFRNTKTGTLIVKDKEGQVRLEGLQYFSQINGGFQGLNQNTEIVYYNYNLKKLNAAPEPKTYGYYGNVPTYLLKIEKQNNK